MAPCKTGCDKTLKIPLSQMGSATTVPQPTVIIFFSTSVAVPVLCSCQLFHTLDNLTFLLSHSVPHSRSVFLNPTCHTVFPSSLAHLYELFILPKESQVLVPPVYVQLTSNHYFTYHGHFPPDTELITLASVS